MTTTEVVAYQQSTLSTRANYARTLADASDLIPRGLFDRQTGRPSPAKILLVMETGAMLGLAPMAAIAGIDVIEGKAAISPRVALGLFRSAGHKVKIVEEGTVETGDLKVTVTLTRKDDPENPIDASFTPQQALRAGLVDSYALDQQTGLWVLRARSQKGEVKPWEAYTEDMCLWRATGRLGRRGGQDVLMGIGYIPEELEVLVDEDGVRQPDDKAAEDAIIAEFKQFTDKAEMSMLWHREHPMMIASDAYTDRVDAEFKGHLSTLTIDSRPPKPGAPGQTGEPTLDQQPGINPDGSVDADVVDDDEAPATVTPPADPKPADHVTAPTVEIDQEEWDRRERAAADEAYDNEHRTAQAGIDFTAMGD